MEIPEADLAQYEGMPSMNVERTGAGPGDYEAYVLPPVKYPDGKINILMSAE